MLAQFPHTNTNTCTLHSPHSTLSFTRIQVLLLLMYNLHMKQEHSSKNGFFHWKIHVRQLFTKHWKEIECSTRQV